MLCAARCVMMHGLCFAAAELESVGKEIQNILGLFGNNPLSAKAGLFIEYFF